MRSDQLKISGKNLWMYPHEIYGAKNNIRIVNNPVKEEHPDNQRFLKDVESWLGVPIEYAVNPKFPDSSAVTVWDKYNYMSLCSSFTIFETNGYIEFSGFVI